MQNKKLIKTFIWLTIFAIAMGFLESAVVIYIRELYYPDGFEFPLQVISSNIMIVEILREFATIIMLIVIGVFSGRTKTEKFGFFLFCFAIWDLFYYVFLKIFLAWPETLLTWDVLFLIPLTWVGPVICPVLLSFAMIALSLVISLYTNKSKSFTIKYYEWALLVGGSVIVIISFVWEYVKFMLLEFRFKELFQISKLPDLLNQGLQFIPQNFPWFIFITGFLFILTPITNRYFKLRT